MILADSPVIEIAAGTVNDSTAQEVYRNLQVLYGTHTGEQALDRDFGIDISTTDYPKESAQALLAAEYVRKTNYKEIFTSARFGNALKNTALLTVVISICENALALGLALLVDNVIKGKNLFRAIFYLPVILSGIVSGFIWKIMYSYNFGPVNKVLDMIGLGALKQDWLGNADIAIWAVAVVMIWKGAGYYMIIYLAALQGVPQDVQEAATIDGASALQRFRFITLPLISGSFTICFTLSLINGLKVFDQIAVMTDGGPGFATETIVYLLYESGFGEGRQGYGTAVGVVLLFIILILNNIQSAILRKREVQL